VATDYPDDPMSELTFRFMELMNGGPSREMGIPWELLIRSIGIDDLETFSEVWNRAGIARRVYEEADRLKHSQNGQH
jgi:hypothetical protein